MGILWVLLKTEVIVGNVLVIFILLFPKEGAWYNLHSYGSLLQKCRYEWSVNLKIYVSDALNKKCLKGPTFWLSVDVNFQCISCILNVFNCYNTAILNGKIENIKKKSLTYRLILRPKYGICGSAKMTVKVLWCYHWPVEQKLQVVPSVICMMSLCKITCPCLKKACSEKGHQFRKATWKRTTTRHEQF